MNVLVLNLTRLGDLLQSQPALAGLAAGGGRVGLVCLEAFAPAAGLMGGLSQVFPLPGERLDRALAGDWRLALAAHRELLDDIRRRFPPDIVINLTPSEPARLLALALGLDPGHRLGFALDAEGFNADCGLWAPFLQLSSRDRCASPFNVADLFRRICGLTGPVPGAGLPPPDAALLRAARGRIAQAFPAPPPRGYVALQPGASHDRRRWPVESFALVARGLWAAGYGPVLLGTEAERPLGQRLRALAEAPVADLMGATDLPGLAAALSCCDLLVTNDTGTMHLAAGLGVRSVALFLATAQPWDTGPYLPGCLCLEPDLPCHPCAFGEDCGQGEACRRAMDPQGVLNLALDVLAGAPRPARVAGARVWRTLAGADGLLDLESLSGHEAEDRTRLLRLLRRHYRPYLDGEALEPPGRAAGLSPQAAAPLAAALDEALALLHLLARQGETLLREPLPALRTKFLATWQRVRGCLESRRPLGLLASLWTVAAERPGQGLPELLALSERLGALLAGLRRDL